jgi:uncharacterized protein (TIGR02996 family)
VTTDREALIAAVIQYPDDDTPRLIFADWCEENGEPERATLIRRLEELFFVIRDTGMKWCYFKGPSISRQESEIIHREMLPPEPRECGSIKIRRGFVEKMDVPWTTFHDHADTLAKSHPIREVTLTTLPNYVAQGNRYVMMVGKDAGGWEYRWETTEGYDDLCRMFKDWLAAHWTRINFKLPPEPIARQMSGQRFYGNGTSLTWDQSADRLLFRNEYVRIIQPDALLAPNPASSPRSDPSPPA